MTNPRTYFRRSHDKRPELGYTGAITWFAPVQPLLAVAALVMTAGALLMRLRGQILCSPSPSVIGLRLDSNSSAPSDQRG